MGQLEGGATALADVVGITLGLRIGDLEEWWILSAMAS